LWLDAPKKPVPRINTGGSKTTDCQKKKEEKRKKSGFAQKQNIDTPVK